MTPQQFIAKWRPVELTEGSAFQQHSYNERPTWLELAHLELDRAVLAAYGWPEEWAEKLQPNRDKAGKVNPILGCADPNTEQDLLARLLALNLSGTGTKLLAATACK